MLVDWFIYFFCLLINYFFSGPTAHPVSPIFTTVFKPGCDKCGLDRDIRLPPWRTRAELVVEPWRKYRIACNTCSALSGGEYLSQKEVTRCERICKTPQTDSWNHKTLRRRKLTFQRSWYRLAVNGARKQCRTLGKGHRVSGKEGSSGLRTGMGCNGGSRRESALEGGMICMGGLRWHCSAGGGRFLKAEHIGPRCSLLTDDLQHKNNQSRKDRQGRGGRVVMVWKHELCCCLDQTAFVLCIFIVSLCYPAECLETQKIIKESAGEERSKWRICSAKNDSRCTAWDKRGRSWVVNFMKKTM